VVLSDLAQGVLLPADFAAQKVLSPVVPARFGRVSPDARFMRICRQIGAARPLRTNLWVVPRGGSPSWCWGSSSAAMRVDPGGLPGRCSPAGRGWLKRYRRQNTARQILTTIAAAIITVVGIVFSITIVALDAGGRPSSVRG